jgi:hypothetical protein
MADVAVLNTTAELSGDTLLTAGDNATVVGLLTFDRDPGVPFAVTANSAKVTNLDADMVDGLHAADLAGAGVGDTETITGEWTFDTDPIFNADAIPETAIEDGALLARVADNETITGTWTFDEPIGQVAGSSAVSAKLGGIIYASSTTTGNVGTGEDTLYTQSLPANILGANNESIEFYFVGQTAANANVKRFRVKYGSTTIIDSGGSATPNAKEWAIQGKIIRVSATSQVVHASLYVGSNSDLATTVSTFNTTTASETLSGAVSFTITGEASTTNDIQVLGGSLKWLPAGN